jgi:hypothetical protein
MTSETASSNRTFDAFVRQLRSVAAGGAASDSVPEETLGEELSTLMDAWNPQSPFALEELVEALCELALHPDAQRSDLGQRLIFGSIVEHLADSFEPDKTWLYDQLFARVIDCCRRHQAGLTLDLLLSRFGISSAELLLARKARHKSPRTFPVSERHRIRRVFVPSRVTLGADVAVTSIVLQKVERVFPRAESVVLGPAAVGELLEGTARGVRFVDCPYHRRGGLVARLDSWVGVVEAIQSEIGSHDLESCLLLDPDSRLTQLGLLPLVQSEVPSFFFESRAYQRHGVDTLGELTGLWLNDILGADHGDRLYPKVVVTPSLAAAARAVAQRARANGAGHLTTMTLGVGGNARKRITGRFELELVRALLSEGGTIVLDKGVDEEVARLEAIVAMLRAEGFRVVELTANPLALPGEEAGQLLVHQGGLRSLLALVAASDLYVGYDSAFQHVAAAVAVPVIDVFVNPPNALFAQRWRPYSRAPVRVVGATTANDPDGRDLLTRVVAAYREHRAADHSR